MLSAYQGNDQYDIVVSQHPSNMYGMRLYPHIGNESLMKPYMGFRHHGIPIIPPIAISCDGDNFTFSMSQNLIATDGN